MYKKLVWILAVILLILAADRIIFTSSDIKIQQSPEVLKASLHSEMMIEVYRTNILGFKVPFSELDVYFVIEDGKNLIELTGIDGSSAKLRSKGVEGAAVLGIYSVKSGMQVRKIMISILPRDVAALMN
ncbi:MAG TPA: hypothetical protein PLN22_01090 [Ignavibacteria bacterium]|nr:hypothetical protein [Ignavibacteria bacterium]